jgi:pyrimidine-specific ribonucleoside hydrolase
MRRKGWIIGGSILGGLVVILLLLTAAVPLLVRLGVQPVCIEGNWPDLKVVPCPSPTPAAQVVTPIPTQPGQKIIPIIVDDDGSPDGVLALLYFLHNPSYDVRAVTVSYGEAHPAVFARHIARLLAGLGRSAVPVGAGQDAPLAGNNAFPDPWRQGSDDFWGIALPEAGAVTDPLPAAELMVQVISSSPEPIVVFISGAHTNLAQALRLAPDIAANIREVRVMGGSVYTAGNIKSDWPAIDNSTAEWNIWVDPLAASEVFSSGLALKIMPLDSTQKVVWVQADALGWASAGSAEGVLAGDVLDWMLKSWSPKGVYVWDLATAVTLDDGVLCPPVALALEVVTAPGPDQGRTKVVAGRSPNASVCLEPVPEQVRARAANVLGR